MQCADDINGDTQKWISANNVQWLMIMAWKWWWWEPAVKMISASGTGVCTDGALHKHKVLFMQIWFSHFEISALCFLCTLHTQHDLIPVHPINFYRLWCYNHRREALLIQMVVFGKISSSASAPSPPFPHFFLCCRFFHQNFNLEQQGWHWLVEGAFMQQ